jgi:hypothetical protein
MSISITSGSMPTVLVGEQSVGYFVTDYVGPSGVVFEFSTDGVVWEDVNPSPTFLGAASTSTWFEPDEGNYAVVAVSLTPEAEGMSTIYIRAYIAGETPGPTYSTEITSYVGVGGGFAVNVEYWSGSTWEVESSVWLPQRFSDQVVVGVGGAPRQKYRINGVEILPPAGLSSGTVVVALDLDGAIVWSAWVGGVGSSGLNGIDQAPDGSIYVLMSPGAQNRTFYNQDGTEAFTDVYTVSGNQILVAKLHSTGNWSGDSCRVTFSGSQTIGTVEIWAQANVILVAGPLSSAASGVTVAGTALVNVARSSTTTWAAGLNSDLGYEWGRMWERGTFHRSSLGANGTAYVVSTASSPFPSVGGVAASNATGIARIGLTGNVLGHDGAPPSSVTSARPMQITSDASHYYLSARTASSGHSAGATWTDGSVTTPPAPSSGFTVALWKRDLAGTTVGATLVTTVPSSTNGTTNSGTRPEAIAVAGANVLAPVSSNHWDNRGTVIFELDSATLDPVRQEYAYWIPTSADRFMFPRGFAVDGAGNVVTYLDPGGNEATDTVLVDADGTTSQTLMLRNSWLTTLSEGVWGQLAGGELTFGPPTPPESVDWPASLVEGDILIANVTGYDPENTGGTAFLEILALDTGTWVPNPTNLVIPGKGVLSVIKDDTSIDTGAVVTVTPTADWFGTLRVWARWRIVDPDYELRTSAATTFITVYDNDPEPPAAPTGDMPTVPEDTSSTGAFTFTDPDKVGTYTWQLSPQTSKPDNWDVLYPDQPQPDWHTTTGTTITVLDADLPVGTATISSQDDSIRAGYLTFTPNANWNGTAKFDARVSNGLWSAWVTVFVTVEPVGDAPSALIGDIPDTNEDTPVEYDLTWVDPDVDPADGAGGYTIELAEVQSDGQGGYVPIAWTDSGEIEVDLAVIRVVAMAEDDLAVTMRTEPSANEYGTYRFAARVREDSTPAVYGPSRILEGNILSVPDQPGIVQGRMPAARWGQTVEGMFTTFDPDTGETYAFQIEVSDDSTSFGSTLSLPGGVNLEVIDTDLTDQQAIVRMTQTAPGATVTSYSFWVRALDSTGLASIPVKVTGVIGSPITGVWLQRLVRGVDVATVETRTPLRAIRTLSFTDSLDAAGFAEVEVSADELLRRAADLGTSPTMLVDSASVELLVAIGGQPVFCGPITETAWETARETVRISAGGLLNYFDRRLVDSDTVFVGVDMSTIVSDLIDTSQSADYGHLAISDATSPAGTNATMTFTAGTPLSDALGTIAERVGAPEIWIDADRQLRAQPTRGIDNRSRVRISSGVASVASWATRLEGIVTVARVVGADNNGSPYVGVYASPTALATYGRIERTYLAPQLLSNADCELLAQRIVEASASQDQALTLELVVTPQRTFTLSDLGVGDVVTVDLRDQQLGQILGAYRIINRTAQLIDETSGSYRVTLDVEPARYVSGKLVGSRSRHNPAVLTDLSRLALTQRQS